MPQWTIGAQFTVEAETPDAALAWLRAELAARLPVGEEGSPWQAYNGSAPLPHYVVGSIRRVADEPGVPARRRAGE